MLFEADGDVEAAVQSYRRAAAINPKNAVFAEALKQGEGEGKTQNGEEAKLAIIIEDGFVPRKAALKIPLRIYATMSIDIPIYANSEAYAEKYIKIFTSLEKEVIDALVEEHKQDPGRRVLQKRLAEEVTTMVHSKEALDAAIEASGILFGKATKDSLAKLDEQTFLDIFDGVPMFEVSKERLGQPAVELFTQDAKIFPSKGEMRKMVQGGGVSVNKEKLQQFDRAITEEDLIEGKYILVQRGKKNYFLVTVK